MKIMTNRTYRNNMLKVAGVSALAAVVLVEGGKQVAKFMQPAATEEEVAQAGYDMCNKAAIMGKAKEAKKLLEPTAKDRVAVLNSVEARREAAEAKKLAATSEKKAA